AGPTTCTRGSMPAAPRRSTRRSPSAGCIRPTGGKKLYTNQPQDLSRTPTLKVFLERYELLLRNAATAVTPGGQVAILMGDYCDREVGFVPLVFYTKLLAFRIGLRQCSTDIIRFSHGAS